jgi:hypothetical protein
MATRLFLMADRFTVSSLLDDAMSGSFKTVARFLNGQFIAHDRPSVDYRNLPGGGDEQALGVS